MAGLLLLVCGCCCCLCHGGDLTDPKGECSCSVSVLHLWMPRAECGRVMMWGGPAAAGDRGLLQPLGLAGTDLLPALVLALLLLVLLVRC